MRKIALTMILMTIAAMLFFLWLYDKFLKDLEAVK